MLAQEIDCQDIDSGPTLPAMDSPCAPRGLDALNEKRRVARTAARHSANKLPWGAATRKKEAEAHRRLQVHFCLRSLGGPRFRSLLRLAADRKFRVVGKRWQALPLASQARPGEQDGEQNVDGIYGGVARR